MPEPIPLDHSCASGNMQGFYPGGTAIAFRQMTNWASRQGFTEFVRDRAKVLLASPAPHEVIGQHVRCVPCLPKM